MSGYEVNASRSDPTGYPYDLGLFSRPLSSKNNEAQVWFDRGLNWAYAFNHEEACVCFEQVIAHDPTCAMGYWGLAYASGPNYNKAWGTFDEKDLKAAWHKCHHLSKRANEELSTATAVEKALVGALQHRFLPDQAPEDLAAPNMAYADAMKEVHGQFGDDLEVVAMYADALMALAPKRLFESATGKPILTSPVLEVKAVLERGMTLPGGMAHPGILHLYIHLMEMSATPEVALVPADHLRGIVPEGGHMLHMPSHIDVLVGEYRRAVDSNMKATIADDKFLAHRGAENFYSLYRLHNYHSLIYAAMLAGQSKVALEATSRMEATITEDLLRIESPPMANWMEFFIAVRVHVLIRFGMWEELKKISIPQDLDRDLYCVTIATTHYGRGIAWAATGNVEKAHEERILFRAAAKRVPPTRVQFPNKIVDVLKVAAAMLDGEIEYRRSNYAVAFEKLTEAIVHEDSLHYTEPWGWMVPTRHAYAALSLEQGRVEDATRAYAEDLGLEETLTRAHQHPNNIWALHGYHECLVRLGRTAEARIISKQLTLAAAVADIPVQASCFCRLEVQKPKGCCV
ncbi:hypothetical protein BK809_0000369 [Diplodia seriata]|uniref:Tpr domain protein n=1 Tax=Diplodia seriata TaxID=420778 RepID=A0A1S8B9W0_9PEZI|nr:hypothetical protein BK809_0000369 [Diplodia seriata]